MEERFSRKITCLNALMLLLVIVMHSNNLYLYDQAGAAVTRLQNFVCYNLCEAGVPLMLFISGFLLYRNLSYANLRQKLARRVHTLLIPYLLWNGLYFLFFLAVTRIPALSGALLSGPVPLTLSSVLSGVLLYAENPAAWFLLQLILFSAACPLLFPLLRKKLSCILLLSAVFALNLLPVDPFPLRADALFYYLLGAASAIHARPLIERRCARPLLLLSLFGLILYELGFYSEPLFGFTVPNVLLRTILLLCVYFLSDALDWTNQRPLLCRSFFVYVSHMLVLGAVRVLLYRLLPHSPAFTLLAWLISILVTVAVSEGIACLLERFLPAFYRVLTGDRPTFLFARKEKR